MTQINDNSINRIPGEVPSPPSNALESYLVQNSLSSDARAVLHFAFRGEQFNSVSNLETQLPSDSETYHAFWEEGAVAPTRRFSDVVEDVDVNPARYTRIISRDPSSFVAPLDHEFAQCLAVKPKETEAEAIKELDRYLETVSAVASSSRNKQIAEQANLMRQELGYIDELSFDMATEKIAQAWVQYLKDHPDAVINVFRRPNSRFGKSFEYVLDKVKDSVVDNSLDAAMRVIESPDRWQDGPESKFVVLDDWIISGQSVSKIVSMALRTAERKGLDFKGKTEVHTVARSATAVGSPGVTYRSIYLHGPLDATYEDVSMIGSHSGVNYGFEYPIRDMQKFLQSRGIFIASPLLAAIDPTMYRDMHARDVIDKDQNGQMYAEVSAENNRALGMLRRIFEIESVIYGAKSNSSNVINQNSQEDGHPLTTQQLTEELTNLKRTFSSMSVKRTELRRRLGYKEDRIGYIPREKTE